MCIVQQKKTTKMTKKSEQFNSFYLKAVITVTLVKQHEIKKGE